MTDVMAGSGRTVLLPVPARWCYRGTGARGETSPCGTGRQGNQMNRRPVHAPRLLAPIMPAGRRAVRADRQLLKIRAGAIMWITGPALFLAAQLAAQSAWRTPYSWMANPLSDLGAARCQRTGSGYPLPRYVCSPLHQVMNVSLVALGVLLAGGVLLTARCWGPGAVSRGARALLIAAAAGSVLVGLVPEDVYLPAHLLGAVLGIAVGNCRFVLAGLIRRPSPLARLRPLTLPLSILALAAAVLLLTGLTPAAGFGGMERLAVYPLRCWMVIAGIYLLREATRADQTGRLHSRHTPRSQYRTQLRTTTSARYHQLAGPAHFSGT